jgi:pyruvate formate lyase activating enzyme
MEEGLRHVYLGNARDAEGDATRCPGCDAALIERDGYALLAYRVDPRGRCPRCERSLEGVFATEPGHFGRRRLPVRMSAPR